MKLTMLRGLPGSGKSTYAREQVKSTGNSGRINRDDLRAMLFESVWTEKREQVVIDCEKAIAGVLFEHGMVPIVDDTNLSPRHADMWKEVANKRQQMFQMHDMAVGIETCRERDAKRNPGVGRAVIDRMALQNGLIDWGERPIVLCDIDGTIADGRHREHFVQGGKKDWDSYYSILEYDSPIEAVVKWIQALYADHTICLLSGRPDTHQGKTMLWLMRPDVRVRYHWLFMRAGGDKRPDTMVKSDFLKHLPKEKIAFAIDDRPSVIREVWRANGVRVFPVRGQCEEF